MGRSCRGDPRITSMSLMNHHCVTEVCVCVMKEGKVLKCHEVLFPLRNEMG